jgi:hypothetical protein
VQISNKFLTCLLQILRRYWNQGHTDVPPLLSSDSV